MLTYRLPQFLDYLNHHYYSLYQHYRGRLVELFPSFEATDKNLMIVHDETDQPSEDDMVMNLWKEFSPETGQE